jgi:hypothetical protein
VCCVVYCCCSAAAIPIPGLPHGPTNPFTYSVLGSAVVHLLAQTVVFGAAAVLVDVGVMQLLRRTWAGMHRPAHKHQHHHHHSSSSSPSAAHAQQAGTAGKAAWQQAGVGDNGSSGHPAASVLQLSVAGVDADVAAERSAVEDEEGCEQAMVSGSIWRAVLHVHA